MAKSIHVTLRLSLDAYDRLCDLRDETTAKAGVTVSLGQIMRGLLERALLNPQPLAPKLTPKRRRP